MDPRNPVQSYPTTAMDPPALTVDDLSQVNDALKEDVQPSEGLLSPAAPPAMFGAGGPMSVDQSILSK